MISKNVRQNKIIAGSMVLALAAGILILGSRDDREVPAAGVRHGEKTASHERSSPNAGAIAEASVDSAFDEAARPAQRMFVVETAWSAGKPAEIADRFSTPSAAEVVIRSARLGERFAGRLAAFREGDVIEFPLPDNRSVRGRVHFARQEENGQVLLGGELTGDLAGTFSLGEDERFLGGALVPADGVVAYQIETGRDGAAYLLEKSKGAVVCAEFPGVVIARAVTGGPAAAGAVTADAETTGMAEAAGTEYQLSSRPSAPAVAYLDFDGENVTDSNWNAGRTIAAASSGLSASQITEVWQRVAEDYRPFNIDVTTSRARYDGTPAGRRIRCIVTQTNGWYGSAGGVAMIGSWGSAGTGSYSASIPCWVFSNMLQINPRYVAEAVSHEIGHTLGLSHDGLKNAAGAVVNNYYSGHGSGATSWAPIMGSGYYSTVVQWSAGGYSYNGNSGNNTENDLAIISDARNRAGYVSDEAGGSRATAAPLRLSGSQVSTYGVIDRTGDVDTYSFTTAGGSVTLALASGISGHADLDGRITLSDASGNVLADANPPGSLYPSISRTLAAGTYYVAVTGVGEGAVPGAGYTNYGSLGHYQIVGSGTAFTAVPVIVVDASDATGVTRHGTWEGSMYLPGYYGSNYLTDKNTGKAGGKKVRFTPTLPLNGAYTVYVRWTADKNRANNVPIDILHAGGTTERIVNQQASSGTWVALGTYEFYAGTTGGVTIRNDGANGFVIVDAVKFEKAEASLKIAAASAIMDATGPGVAVTGTWTSSTYHPGYYGSNYLTDGRAGAVGKKRVRFTPTIAVAGEYLVYARWISGADRASNVPVDFVTASGNSTKTISQRTNGASWVLLGTYRFNAGTGGSVTFRNDGANGFVIVDAVRFEQAP